MTWNMRVRQTHRWLSIVFTVAVLIDTVVAVTLPAPGRPRRGSPPSAPPRSRSDQYRSGAGPATGQQAGAAPRVYPLAEPTRLGRHEAAGRTAFGYRPTTVHVLAGAVTVASELGHPRGGSLTSVNEG
jgi:hypothetical protein